MLPKEVAFEAIFGGFHVRHDETKRQGKYRIPSARKKGWDYSSASWVFITINARAQSPPFGARRDGEMFRNDLGESVARNWLLTRDECVGVAFDEWQVMAIIFAV